jgi:hypothetical protein
VFECFFEQVVDLCQEAGLIWGRELYFDGTKVEANADMTSSLGYRDVRDRRPPGQLPDLLAGTEWFAEELAESPGVVSTRELEDDAY